MTALPSVIVDPHFRAIGDIFSAVDLERLHATVDVVWGRDEPMPLDRFRAALPGAAAIVSGGWRYGPVLEEAESLRAILTVSGGWPPELDYARCFERKIRVLSAAPGFAGAVAEMALGLALACSRDICAGDRAMRAGEETWLSAADGLDTFLLSGKRVGFVGFGNIGRRLRDLLEPFGCEVLAYDPWLTDAYLVEERVVPTPLDELLAGSRVIFVLATPTSENQALLSRARLELVAPGAVLVLVSRAHVVDFEALTELVRAGRFRAAIDVYPDEPFDRRAPDPDGARRRALAASGGPRPGGAPGARANGRGRSGGDRTGAAAEAHAGGRARARDPVRPHHAARAAHRMSLADDALAILRGNDTGRYVKPSQRLYPWQWNWDSAFVAIGLARVDPERAQTEVRSLLEGQWADGMVPHIVFHPQPVDYWPGPEVWGSKDCAGAPEVATSGLTQPPVIATAVKAVHEAAPDTAFLEEVVPKLEAWHEWFHRERAHRETGLMAVFHGWESADNAPRFDRALARIDPEGIAPIERTDTSQVAADERPTDLDYRRYLALVRWLRERGYRPRPPSSAPVCVPRPAAQLDPRGRRGRPRRPAVRDRRRQPQGTLGRCTAARRPGQDVGRRGGRVPRTRPARRGRRDRDDRRSVSALRRRSRCRARPADGR